MGDAFRGVNGPFLQLDFQQGLGVLLMLEERELQRAGGVGGHDDDGVSANLRFQFKTRVGDHEMGFQGFEVLQIGDLGLGEARKFRGLDFLFFEVIFIGEVIA